MKPGAVGNKVPGYQPGIGSAPGSNDAAKVGAGVAEKVPDVFEEGGKLFFPESKAPVSHDTKVERARRMLAALRAKTESRQAFGGRVTIGGIDKAGSLGNYYPTLRAAGDLTRAIPEAHSGVVEFIGQVSMPGDLIEWRDKGANLRPCIRAEPNEKIGERHYPDYESFKTAFNSCDPDALAVSDDCMRDVIFNSDVGTHLKYDLNEWFGAKTDARMKVAWVRLYARAAEIGIDANFSKLQEIADVLPADSESAKVLARAARAMGQSIEQVTLGGKKPTDFHEEPPTIEPPQVIPASNQPVGDRAFSPDEFWKAWAEGDFKALEVDDPSLDAAIRVAMNDKDPRDKIHAFFDHGDDFRTAGIHVLARARETGLALPVSSEWIGKYIPATHGGRAAERRLYRAFGWGERQWSRDGTLPQRIAPRRGSDLGAVGEADHTARDLKAEWNKPLEGLLKSNDETVTALFEATLWKLDSAVEHFDSHSVFDLYARRSELASIEGGKDPVAYTCERYFLEPVPAKYATDEGIGSIARLARAIHLDFDHVRVEQAGGGVIKLSEHPALKDAPIVKAEQAREAALDKAVGALDPARSIKPEQRRKAILDILGKDGKHVHEFSESFGKLLEARIQGQVQPLDLSKMPDEARHKFVKDCTFPWKSWGAGEVLFGLCAKITPDDMVKSTGGSSSDQSYQRTAHNWGSVIESIGNLSGKELEFVLADVREDPSEDRTSSLYLRSLLATETEPEALKKSITEYFEHADKDYQRARGGTVGEARAILDKLAMLPADSEARASLLNVLDAQAAQGKLTPERIQAALAQDPKGALKEQLQGRAEAAISDAVAEVVSRGAEVRGDAMTDLAAAISTNAVAVSVSELAQFALGQLYQADLTNVMPLGQAEKETGKVKGKDKNLEPAFAPGTKTVEVGGVDLAINAVENKDLSAVPTQAQADLVMTETTKRNLEMMAINWRSERFTLLEGPTSSGKTAMARYLAWKTETPSRRVNLSADTTVEDLIGRMVGGEEKYARGKLAEMNADQLIAIAQEYGIETHDGPATKGWFGGVKDAPRRSKGALIKDIMDVQEKPRWVDGIIVQAMKRGEMVILDEINLARPAVLGRLNELLVARGKITLKEHEGEVIDPVDGFKVIATMNPSTDRGRGKMSAEQYDRWSPITCHALTKGDLTQILDVRFGKKLPKAQRDMLVASHEVLSKEADKGVIGRKAGGLAYSLRNLEKVAERFIHFGKASGLDAPELMRRELQEVYRDGLSDPEDLAHVDGILNTTAPCKEGVDFYGNLKLEKVDGGYRIGDVFIERLGLSGDRVPGEESQLIMTKRASRVFYQMCKALELNENVMLIGEKGGGKTSFAEMYAHLRGQPFFTQLMTTQTDSPELIGDYGDNGWHDGLLLQAARPDVPPGVVLLDEYLFGNTALTERINSALDDERALQLTEKGDGSERVQLHPQAKVIAATNPPTKDYSDRSKFSPASRNRFTVINVPEIDTAEERLEIATGISKKLDIQEGVAAALCELHEWTNAAYQNPYSDLGKELPIRQRPNFSMRNLLGALETVQRFVGSEGEIEAYLKAVKSTYAARGTPEDCKVVYDKAVAMSE